MTKQVRIENADTSDHKVRVRYQEKQLDTGEWIDVEYGEIDLTYPTALASMMIHSTRRVVVEEYIQ